MLAAIAVEMASSERAESTTLLRDPDDGWLHNEV